MKRQAEIKFNDSHIDYSLREKTLKFIANQDIRIFYTYLKLENIPKEYKAKEGKVKTGSAIS